jgi:hypothetical protein
MPLRAVPLRKYLYAHANPISGWDPSGYSLLQAVNDLSLRIFITVNLTYPRVAFAIGFVISLAIPAEVGVGLPPMGQVGSLGLRQAWAAAKELTIIRRAYESAKRSGSLQGLGTAGRQFEAWILKVLGAQKNTQAYKGGVPVRGTPAGSKIPDVTMFKESILEVKSKGIDSRSISQAMEYARIAKNEGRGITYIFEFAPDPEQLKRLREAIASVAPDVNVAFNVVYP